MRRKNWFVVAAVIFVPLVLAACGGTAPSSEPAPPATVTQVKGSEVSRITLSEEAAQRIAVRTAYVMADVGAPGHNEIPYAAVFYAPDGKTWTYVSEKPLTFMRHPITVDRIDGNVAVLSSGPPVGTKVATVGIAELYGTETDVGED